VHNIDWRPFFKTFMDVEMVLVPVGCFMMGSTSANDEQPVHRQCLDQPFWIDRTEVSNQTFGSTGTFTGANYPRDSVSWTDAYTHCQRRGARLPNEVEWEYAARGPDSLVYPWGNTMISSNTIYYPNYDINNLQYPAGGSSMPVGSYPLGASWTGAVDMSGNLWEWVNSRYSTSPTNGSVYAYPYDKNDGREQYSAASDTPWGLRGGSWGVDASRTTTHFRNFSYAVPQRNLYGIGFRCLRDHTPGDQKS
jgi:formylglycine-generating enzyme required for sulfatase activity